jgi:hypothetical protein
MKEKLIINWFGILCKNFKYIMGAIGVTLSIIIFCSPFIVFGIMMEQEIDSRDMKIKACQARGKYSESDCLALYTQNKLDNYLKNSGKQKQK